LSAPERAKDALEKTRRFFGNAKTVERKRRRGFEQTVAVFREGQVVPDGLSGRQPDKPAEQEVDRTNSSRSAMLATEGFPLIRLI
jgi:hypothetical protein